MQLGSDLPEHLQKYIVKQSYENYTYEDQAVWRYIMRQLKKFLSEHAHSCYTEGLEKTGITLESIPKVSDINEKLKQFGWGAIPVSGFIPPAAFMEFQARGYLPIACDLRSIKHIPYTPAPDIVHEAAGHAPIIVDPQFSSYLKNYAEIAAKAIISKEDIDLYTAIRNLSDIKENPKATAEDVLSAEKKLNHVSSNMSFVSEASLLGRMNWWTAEYGLIGDIKSPKIFGAGLLSSVSEAKECLTSKVKKIPLDISCLDYSYDITEPQPQLFVTPNFQRLKKVLDEMANTMAFKRGGTYGLEKAKEALTINTVELNSGLQISGILTDFYLDESNQPIFLRFVGPTQLCFKNEQLIGHGTSYHKEGYSTPLGPIVDIEKELFNMTKEELKKEGFIVGCKVHFTFKSGIDVSGELSSLLRHEGRTLLMTFKQCTVKRGTDILFDPSWGDFDLALGSEIPSVFGGPADRPQFEESEKFIPIKIPPKTLSKEQKEDNEFYAQIRNLRKDSQSKYEQKTEILHQLTEIFFKSKTHLWLAGLELLELGHSLSIDPALLKNLESKLLNLPLDKVQKKCLKDGILLAPEKT